MRVNAGEEFSGLNVTLLIDEPEKKEIICESSVRFWIAASILVAALLFLIGAALRGVLVGDFMGLRDVWGVASVPVSSIITFYFVKHPYGNL